MFLTPLGHAEGEKGTKMSRNNDSKKRKSNYNRNRTCYLSSDGKYYCYEAWDPDAKRMVTQKLEVGKDLSLELTLITIAAALGSSGSYIHSGYALPYWTITANVPA